MTKRKPEAMQTTWADFAECVPAWEKEYGCRVELHVVFHSGIKDGAYVEAVLTEGNVIGRGAEIYRHRAPFPVYRPGGQAGAAMHCVFEAFHMLDNNPWLWPEMKRKSVVTEP